MFTLARWIAPLSLIALCACGGDEEPAPQPPQITELAIRCAPLSGNSAVDRDVVVELSALVSDPDRDLVRVEGNLNGVPLDELSDDDGDQRFNWTPPASLDPIACSGQMNLRVWATDLAGNTAELVEAIAK